MALVHYQAYPPVAELARPYLLAGRAAPGPGHRRPPAHPAADRPVGDRAARRRGAADLTAGRGVGQHPDVGAGRAPVRVHRGRAGRGRRLGRATRTPATAVRCRGCGSATCSAATRLVGGGPCAGPGTARSLLALGARRARRWRCRPTVIEPRAGGGGGQAVADGDLPGPAAHRDRRGRLRGAGHHDPAAGGPGHGRGQGAGPGRAVPAACSESPDGEHLLVHRLQRPFSFRVPYGYFARRVEVWSAHGAARARGRRPAGQRRGAAAGRADRARAWCPGRSGARPAWSGPRRWTAATRSPRPSTGTGSCGCAGAVRRRPSRSRRSSAAPLPGLVRPERARPAADDRARPRPALADHLAAATWPTPDASRVMFDHSVDDAYADPGSPLAALQPGRHPDRAAGRPDRSTCAATAPARRATGRSSTAWTWPPGGTTRLFRSPADAYEQRARLRQRPAATAVLIWHESPRRAAEPGSSPASDGARRQAADRLARPASAADRHGQAAGHLRPRRRGAATGMLYLPPGYDPARDGRLPLVIWAYPLDFGDAATAGQVRGSSQRFTRLQPGRAGRGSCCAATRCWTAPPCR